MKPPNACIGCRIVDPGASIAARQSTRLAGVEKDQRLLRLDAIADPILQTCLSNAKFRQRLGVRSALVVLGNEIEAALMRVAMGGGKEYEGVARMDFRRHFIDGGIEASDRRFSVKHGLYANITIEARACLLQLLSNRNSIIH